MDPNRNVRSAPLTPKQISDLFKIPIEMIHQWIEEGLEYESVSGKTLIYGEDLTRFESIKRAKGEPTPLDPFNPANEQLNKESNKKQLAE